MKMVTLNSARTTGSVKMHLHRVMRREAIVYSRCENCQARRAVGSCKYGIRYVFAGVTEEYTGSYHLV